MTSPLRTLLAMIREGAALQEGPILTFVEARPDGGLATETRSYAELLERGQRIAGALIAEGMQPGDSFAIILRNHPEFVDAMVGSEIAGTVFVPVDPRTRGDKLAYMLRFSRCRGAIVSRALIEHLRPLLGSLPDLRWVWVIDAATAENDQEGPFLPLATKLAAAEPAATAEPRPLDAPMQMLFTSGTTGDPKAILAPYARFAEVASLGPVIGLEPGDRLYTGLSLTHANAQLITLGNALAGRLPLVVSRQFTKSRLWEIVAQYGCTSFNLLGGMATAIFAEPPGPFDRAHKVRFVLSAGMPATMWEAFEERFGVRVFEFFGAAEGGLTLNPPGTGPVGSIGKAPRGVVCEILDEDDQVVAAGVEGEICFRNADGTVAPVRYFGNPEASAAKTRGGWFRTGDIGWKDAEGWIFFSHRAGQSIRRNGDFVNARAIEAAIAAMSGVADVYVYGVATADNAPGEKEVVAAIVPGEGWGEASTIFAACARDLGSTSVPSIVQILDEIPKTASEKPQDRHLIAMLSASDAKTFDKNGPVKVQMKERELQ